MNKVFSKTPFLALLLPLLVGILLQYYLLIDIWSILFFLGGGIVMLYSFMLPTRWEYSLRWLFTLGICLFMIGLGILSTAWRQSESMYDFPNRVADYEAIIIDSPKEKPQSLAYDAYVSTIDKKIICYVSADSVGLKQLKVGDKFLFRAKIVPFQNRDRSNEKSFDYVTYMHDKGFAGSVYLVTNQWVKVGEEHSLKTRALSLRAHILQFYQTLNLSSTEYSILSGLTLGYQEDLTEDILQGFRTTGTVHVLSVSGLHVGLIYAVIVFLLGFIKPNHRFYKLKPTLIIIFLWFYAFVTGLSPSVVRASIMLTIYCFSELFGRRSQAINALYITAFFMLIYNPLSFFDIGFQLSFASVFTILQLHPTLAKSIKIKNSLIRKIWQLFCLSLVAQLATFPICLYYFGTFPTYFFITNLLIVPLVTLIIYTVFGVLFAKFLGLLLPSLLSSLLYIPVSILKALTFVMTSIIRFFEQLPFALLENIKLPFGEFILLVILIISLSAFFINRNSKMLNLSFVSALFLLIVNVIYIL